MRIVRVTMTRDFVMPENQTPQREEAILKEWFEDPRYPLGHRHAYRDGSAIGNSERLVKFEIKELGHETKVV